MIGFKDIFRYFFRKNTEISSETETTNDIITKESCDCDCICYDNDINQLEEKEAKSEIGQISTPIVTEEVKNLEASSIKTEDPIINELKKEDNSNTDKKKKKKAVANKKYYKKKKSKKSKD